MPAYDGHLHAFQDDLAERYQLDPGNKAASLFRVSMRVADELAVQLNAMALRQATLLSKWRAEDRARRSSTRSPVVCRDCGARRR